jgi:hypothetical protein
MNTKRKSSDNENLEGFFLFLLFVAIIGGLCIGLCMIYPITFFTLLFISFFGLMYCMTKNSKNEKDKLENDK